MSKNIDLDIAKKDAELKELLQRKADALSRKYVTCESSVRGKGCGAKLQIGKLTYIQTLWYERPYGCTDGDKWHDGEGQFDCPKCGNRNRLFERPNIEALKYSFKEVVEEHEKVSYYNNFA